MLAQLCSPHKKLIHILFAMFCGSMAMVAAQKITAESIGPFQYLVAMGACFTCNLCWLFARAMFRNEGAVTAVHIILAAAIALLVIGNQGFNFLQAMAQQQMVQMPAQVAVRELMGLLSSAVLVLTFWEGVAGWSAANYQEKAKRLVFIFAFSLAVGSVMIGAKLLPATTAAGEPIRDWIALCCSILMMLVMQTLLIWPKQKASAELLVTETATDKTVHSVEVIANHGHQQNDRELSESDLALSMQIRACLVDSKQYLQASLKVADLAREFDVSEYRISRVIKSYFKGINFNHFVNQLRVEHAKALLADVDNAHWPVIVVGLESGFSSVGPFTRAFKAQVGTTPGQYRKTVLAEQKSESLSRLQTSNAVNG